MASDGMAEPREIELKLQVPAGAMSRLGRLPLLRHAAPRNVASLLSVYYDTGKRKLRRHGLSLRVRRRDGRYVQTVKQQRGKSVGLFERGEWKTEIAGRRPDLAATRGTALHPYVDKKLCRKLKPIFQTRVRRQVFPIRQNGSEIAFTLDCGKVEAAGRSTPLHELELELKGGEAKQLFAVARTVGRQVPLQLASAGKDGLGYALVDKQKPAPVKAEPIALTADADWASAFRTIARACLYQLAANEAALRRGDLEAVHQMRIGLRRLRTAISLFADMLRGRQTETIKRRLKRLTAQLGAARELDVFVKRVVRRVEKPGAGAAVGKVAADFRDRRAAALADVQAVAQSAQFRRLLLDALEWIEIGDWTGNETVRALRQCPVATGAAEELRRRSKKIRRQSARLAELDARHRHKLRVRVKKLRYACAFFAGVFAGKKPSRRREKFAAKLKTLQGALGDLNDIVVHQGLARQSVEARSAAKRGGGRRTKQAFAAGRLAGREEGRFAAVMKTAERGARTFAKAKPFWR
jgi:inorganic triphosphatase YgiF